MSVPDPTGRPAAPDPAQQPAPEAAPGETATERRRTHPVTPLISGWRLVLGVIAVISAQNIARLVQDFTLQRALIGLGVLLVVVVVTIGFSALSWWFTTYAVDGDGVSLHRGLISKRREYAPRRRIESVSVERPLLARALGLAKVRVEVAGGGESYLDIQYVRSADAEDLRRRILQVAAPAEAETARPTAEQPSAAPAGSAAPASPDADGPRPGSPERSGGRLRSALVDRVEDGELIAEVPTSRLLHSLVRDADFLLGLVASVVGVAVTIALISWQEGFSLAALIPLLTALIAVPRYVVGRIESGWGFVSRITDRGLRMRRGLLNTRTDNIASGRIQRLTVRRPLLWRAPGWTAVGATVAGIEEEGAGGSQTVLPVGTDAELASTLGHLAAPLGTPDDLRAVQDLLATPARQIPGMRTRLRWYWISRRTTVTVLLPGALVRRRGVLSRRLEIIPRERIQSLRIQDDPFGRRLGILDLEVFVAGASMTISGLDRREARDLHAALARDARTLRRYRDREQWPQPALRLATTGPQGERTPA